MIIVTGASNNHYLTLLNMINSFICYNTKNYLIVYNLGLDDNKWNNIRSNYSSNQYISYKSFDFSKYPSWFNINIEAGQYAWKPTIIYNTYIENNNEIIVWMDAGNLIHNNLKDLELFLEKNGVYSAESSGDIAKWTHPDTIKYLNCSNVNNQNRNGACIGFNTKIAFAKDFLIDFYNCAQIKECIYPNGSSRKNHRQDQAVFTILFYKYLYEKNMNFQAYKNSDWQHHLGYSIHNDIEPHWDTNKY
jgi:hypothetical protein